MLQRRDFLKLGAASAVLGLSGCGSEGFDLFNSGNPNPSPNDDRSIVSARISPSIGVARVGNAAQLYYLGPELPGELPSGPFKDPSGAIARQAARFRIYGLDSQGRAVRELTAAEAQITWSVHLANGKAAWYQFETALDIPDARPAGRRNAGVGDRTQLMIDPGSRSLSGTNQRAAFDGGRILNQAVPLGEMRTDAQGRLLVLGSAGRSFSPTGVPLTTFANNDGWCDDTSDGPVTASVTLQGRVLAVEPAWVVVAPPNYGPSVNQDFRTLYDVMTQTMVTAGLLPQPARVGFLTDIYPLFDRLSQFQWVNQGMLQRYGWGSPEDFSQPEWLERLADASKNNQPFRESYLARFRNPDYEKSEPDALPPIYGDAVAVPANSPRNWLAVTPLQYRALQRWAAGDFEDDRQLLSRVPRTLEELPVEAQPFALDRASLEACLGAAFHPGCEVTWPIRIASMYASAYRIRHRSGPERDFGNTLTPAAALASDGPLTASGPGDITRWMAVPWQSDTASCRSGYEPAVDPYLPTFWAPRVPNHVLTEADYQIVLDRNRPLVERQAAFQRRQPFFRQIDNPDKVVTLTNMVANWHRLGLVEARPGPGDGAFPTQFGVESENGF